MAGKDDDNLPDAARRRGNADTLFSADWFEDEDEDAPAGADPAQAPSISAPAMFEPPAPQARPSAPPVPPPAPPPPKRIANPTILPDFDFEEDDEPAPPAAAAPAPATPAPSPPPQPAAQTPDDDLPEIAKRRGNADTLFSADWFDDDDGDEAADAKPDAPAPRATPATAASIDADPADKPAEGSNMALYVGGALLLLVLGCGGIGAGVAVVALLTS